MYFGKDANAYLNNFITSCFAPVEIDTAVVLQRGREEELKELLGYGAIGT